VNGAHLHSLRTTSLIFALLMPVNRYTRSDISATSILMKKVYFFEKSNNVKFHQVIIINKKHEYKINIIR
jgi:hypothetical protein